MSKENPNVNREARIAIVGAGPAGLSTAWFLQKNGYKDVTVLEVLGRVGGLCKSITVDGMSYDIGANYVTWAYKETLKIAKEVGADTYPEKPYTTIDLAGKKPKFRSFLDAALHDPYSEPAGAKISIFCFLWAAIRYLWLRWKLSPIIDKPGYLDTIEQHPALCQDFKSWLEENKLIDLATMFQFPITIMGYGQLDGIATAYALRYMSLKTVFPMVFGRFFSWLIGKWPRRFTFGFQRLWERVAWRLNVRLRINICGIERTPAEPCGVRLNFVAHEQDLDTIKTANETHEYDFLVLACPLRPDVFSSLKLTPNDSEKHLMDKLKFNPYCMTTFWVDGLPLPHPVAPVLPIPQLGEPWAVAQQFRNEHNLFTQFYTRPTGPAQKTDDPDYEKVKKEVIEKVNGLITLLGGTTGKVDQERWHTFDMFTYFQHFSPEDIEAGIYTKLAAMQGADNTFYVGGATDFELVEPIVNHSKHIVDKHFIGP